MDALSMGAIYQINQTTIQHSGDTWVSISTPNYVSHKGVEASAPENTFAAYDISAQQGFPIGMDLYETLDGVLVCRHDNDLSLRSDAIGNVTTSMYSAICNASAGKWFSKNYDSERIPTFEEVLARYGGKNLIQAQVYGVQNDTIYTKIAKMISKMKLDKYVVFEVNSLTDMNKLLTVNPNMLVCITGNQSSVSDVNYDKAFMVNWSESTITQSGINEAKAKGFKVQAYGVVSKERADTLISMGVDFINCVDPVATKGGITFTTPFYLPIGKGSLGSFWKFYQSTGAPLVEDYYLGYMNAASVSAYTRAFIGYTTKLNDTISFNVKFPDVSATTAYVNLCIVPDSDNWNGSLSATSNKNILYLQIYANGKIMIYDVVNGVATSRLNDASAFTALAAGGIVPLSIKFNTSSITLTTPNKNVDVSATITHGHIVPRFSANVIAGFGSIKVTNP